MPTQGRGPALIHIIIAGPRKRSRRPQAWRRADLGREQTWGRADLGTCELGHVWIGLLNALPKIRFFTRQRPDSGHRGRSESAILMQKSPRKIRRIEYATIESGRMTFPINIAYWRLILNQSCAPRGTKSFCNTIEGEADCRRTWPGTAVSERTLAARCHRKGRHAPRDACRLYFRCEIRFTDSVRLHSRRAQSCRPSRASPRQASLGRY